MNPRILVAGIGNIFLGDDAFGVEVVRRLLERPLPAGVEVRDLGIRGFDLACALQDGYDAAILVDTVRRGSPPGTLCVIEPSAPPDGIEPTAGHNLAPAEVLRLVRTMGGRLPRLRLIGCEPLDFGPEGMVGLSPCVQAAVKEAVELALTLIAELRLPHA